MAAEAEAEAAAARAAAEAEAVDEPHPGPFGGRGAAVPCCTVRRSDGGVVVSFACNFPGCDKEYASRDAVRKHCRIRHLAWLQSLQALWQLEDRGAEVGSD